MTAYDPWGCELPSRRELTYCDFVAANGLPCTSRLWLHGVLHYTADGWAWTKEGERV